jgi:signal transduction histidine kinase
MNRPAMQPLAQLRLRLTAWYLATFCLILVLLMGGLFVVIRHQLSQQLDDSLREATSELMRAAGIREMEMVSAKGTVVDAVDELHIPDRALYLLNPNGQPVKPAAAPDWVQGAARVAAVDGQADLELAVTRGRSIRLHAERFTVESGKPYVAVAVADRVELEDRYAALIGAFAGAALVALVLVAGGGYVLVRKSTAPVERTMEYMRRFMADAAHELRTPITVLRSRAEVALQRPRDSSGDAEALRGVERESERLSRIVDDLLILARADAGERQPRRERIYLDDIADDAASAARALAEQGGVTLTVDTFEEAVVLGDPDLIRQLLMIILDNAVKFTPPGGRVGIGVSAPDGRALVEVHDTGIGIPAEQLPHVFDRFYRGDPARARAPSAGAGLGLAIARWIAEVHGATIEINSDVGRGTKVAVRFPQTA